MDFLVLALRFLGVLAVLVLVHELGHFLTAKAFGVQVQEFGIGFPPRLFGVRRGDTLYSINLLPLGGFVKLLGEEDPSHPKSLASRSVLQRSIVLSAGSFMNVLLVVVLFTLLLAVPQEQTVARVAIQEVEPDSPAQAAGLRPGDIVLRVDGHPIRNSGDLLYRVYLRMGAESHWTYQRGSVAESPIIEEATVAVRWRWPAGQGPTGIVIGQVSPRMAVVSEPIWEAFPHALQQTWESFTLTKNEVTRWVMGAGSPQLAGPIGIAQITDQVADTGILPLLGLVAGLSLSLGIMNILPIPMLDGGRLMFVLLEGVRRGKRISPRREGLVHMVGFVALMALIALISYQDILRLIRGESLLQ